METLRPNKGVFVWAIQWGLLLAICGCVFSVQAQKKWTFEQCVNYALEHNIPLNQGRMQSELAENQLKQSKANIAPDLSAGLSGSLGFGMSQNRYGIYANNNSSNANASVGTNWTVFQGGRNAHEIKRQNSLFLASIQDNEKMANDIRMNIASRFLAVLLQKELLTIAQEQVSVSIEIERKTQQLVDRGRESGAKLYEVRAQKASDAYNQTLAERDLDLALLNLAQLLRLDTLNDFDVEVPVFSESESSTFLLSKDMKEVENLPQVQAEKYRLESTQKSLSAARSAFSPSLLLNASVSTAYYYQFAPTEMVNETFSSQMSNNLRGYVGMSLH
ncbi:MAG: TolC family protein, partial [Bacteroidales bacterium]